MVSKLKYSYSMSHIADWPANKAYELLPLKLNITISNVNTVRMSGLLITREFSSIKTFTNRTSIDVVIS